MPSPVDLIKERLNIADVVGSYIKLEKSGASLKAKCPFHNERTPSFFVSPSRGTYYCFGCGAKGDVFSFVQAFEGLDFRGALTTLASRAGVEVKREDPRERSERERLMTLLDTATLFYQQELAKKPEAQKYISGRGLSDETLATWRLGFAPDDWRTCHDFCRGKGFTVAELERAGLVKTEKGKTYDRFRNRVMFPIFDGSGRPVAFSGRILGKEGEHTPKYLNSPETPVFSKSRILYGFDRAKSEIRRKDFAMLVEGQMDLLMCHQSGFKNAVASSGTAFTPEQLTLLKRFSNRILMVYDADKAGVKASLRSAALALAAGMEVKVAALPQGLDPAELLLKSPEQFKRCMRASVHIIDFYLEALVHEEKDERGRVRAIRDRLLPYVAALESKIEQEHFITRIADRTGIRAEAIRTDLSKTAAPAQESKSAEPVTEDAGLGPQKHSAERLLLGVWLWKEADKSDSFDLKNLEKEIDRIFGARAESLRATARGMANELIYQAESYYGGVESLSDAVTDLLRSLEEAELQLKLASAMKELSLAERSGDKEKKAKFLKQCQVLAKRINDLRDT